MEPRIHVLYEMHKYIQKNEYPPTVRELCELVGLKSTSTVHSHIEKLKKEGYLCKEPMHPRAIALTEKAIKLLDGIAAVEEESKDTLTNEDYKTLLLIQKFLKENNFPLTEKFEEIISKINYILK